ncbi:MAG: DUF4402 domain-containing protein, partial [Bacteroidota bacterium]|nr:DUF4402 domain-containing protein [Bacteroidota bacterium]
MRNLLLSIILIALLVGLPVHMMGQISSTAASIGIDGKVIAPISISNTGSTHLDFGTVSRSAVAGSVTVAPDGQRTSAGGVSIL